MKSNRKVLLVLGGLSVALWTCSAAYVHAQEETSDKGQFKALRSEIKSNSESARQDEKALQDQIKQAEASGDRETARSLREQLRSMHQENVQQKQQDQQALQSRN
jgi:DNA-binding ferritin-like protein